MNKTDVLFNGFLAFLVTLGTAAMTVLVGIQGDGGTLADVTTIQWVIMGIGSFITFMSQRKGYQAPPPPKTTGAI